MKQPEYIEGRQAAENFERGMNALFKVPKGEVVKAEKRLRKSRSSSPRKLKLSDKD
jgi:propanediol dehydratase small subunit